MNYMAYELYLNKATTKRKQKAEPSAVNAKS
jgi:hypothetical protein